MKYLVWGDIHGHAKAAARAVALAKETGATGVFLGDYVDRGPANMEVLDTLMEAQMRHPEWIFLRGNHDQMLLDLIHGNAHPKGFDERTRAEAFAEWQALGKATREMVTRFLEGTGFYHEAKHHIFVHAPLKNDGLELHQKEPYDLVWNYDLEPPWMGKPFVHGHLPVDQTEVLPDRINVNTSCGYGGFLGGVLLCGQTGQLLEHIRVPEDVDVKGR